MRLNLEKILLEYDKIKKNLINKFKPIKRIPELFNPQSLMRKRIDGTWFKETADPEAITVDAIKNLIQSIGVEILKSGTSEFHLSKTLKNNQVLYKKPDYRIPNPNPSEKNILFEFEPVGSNLHEKGHGIEQIKTWYELYHNLGANYISIATNFIDWILYTPSPEPDNPTFIEKQISIKEAIKIIHGTFYGDSVKEDIDDSLKIQEEITDKFYNDIEQRIKWILSEEHSTIKILQLDKIPAKIRSKVAVTFYRTIFFRILFIKILREWRLIPSNPVKVIFNIPSPFWVDTLNALFFNVFNRKQNNRPEIESYNTSPITEGIFKSFKQMPYLNGGLFRKSWIEKEYDYLELNQDAYKDIYEFLEDYTFTSQQDADKSFINPDILGFIFERTLDLTGSRHTTGSYYTPSEITEYMSKELIEQLLLDRINKFGRKNDLIKRSIKNIINSETGEIFSDFNETTKESLILQLQKELIGIKICDNACGSGAFLKAAGNEILKYYECIYTYFNWDLPYYSNTLPSDEEKQFKDKYTLKKHIIQNNLYGVDYLTDAIEVCKLRIWLWMVEPDDNTSQRKIREPLPNIDFNIKTGNSVVGLSSIEKETGLDQWMSDSYEYVKLINEYYNSQDSIESNDLRSKLENKGKKIKDLLNKKLIQKLEKTLNKSKLSNIDESNVDKINGIKVFHWYFEFFDVMEKNKGFDIIIGNPPYDRHEVVSHMGDDYNLDYKEILKLSFDSYAKSLGGKILSRFDFSLYFILRSLQLLRPGGYHGYIITDKWTKTAYGQPIKTILKNNVSIKKYINLEGLKVFRGINAPKVDTLIYNIKKTQPSDTNQILYNHPKSIKNLEEGSFLYPQTELDNDVWSFLEPDMLEIKSVINNNSTPLEELNVEILRGITLGFERAFFISTKIKQNLIKEDPNCEQYIKPAVRGANIRKYNIEWQNEWLIVFPKGFTNLNIPKGYEKNPEIWFEENFPSIFNHLYSFKDVKGKGKGLFKRNDQGNYWWEHNTPNMRNYNMFKIMWPEFMENPRFIIDDSIFYCNNKGYTMSGDNLEQLLLILNSSIINFIFSIKGIKLNMGKEVMARMPIKFWDADFPSNTLGLYIQFLSYQGVETSLAYLTKLADALVIELYFVREFSRKSAKDKIYSSSTLFLFNIVRKILIPIEFSEWYALFWKKKIGTLTQVENKNLEKLTDHISTTIKNIINNLQASEKIQKRMEQIFSHKLIQKF